MIVLVFDLDDINIYKLNNTKKKSTPYIYEKCSHITFFISITMLCGIGGIMQNIPHISI